MILVWTLWSCLQVEAGHNCFLSMCYLSFGTDPNVFKYRIMVGWADSTNKWHLKASFTLDHRWPERQGKLDIQATRESVEKYEAAYLQFLRGNKNYQQFRAISALRWPLNAKGLGLLILTFNTF